LAEEVKDKCPKCGSPNVGSIEFKENGYEMQCNTCGNNWFEGAVIGKRKIVGKMTDGSLIVEYDNTKRL